MSLLLGASLGLVLLLLAVVLHCQVKNWKLRRKLKTGNIFGAKHLVLFRYMVKIDMLSNKLALVSRLLSCTTSVCLTQVVKWEKEGIAPGLVCSEIIRIKIPTCHSTSPLHPLSCELFELETEFLLHQFTFNINDDVFVKLLFSPLSHLSCIFPTTHPSPSSFLALLQATLKWAGDNP